MKCDLVSVQKLLKNKDNINLDTALITACSYVIVEDNELHISILYESNLQIIRELIRAGANVNFLSKFDETPLIVRISNPNTNKKFTKLFQ